ncbi:MAG: hypothetical protein J0M12_11675 [Deltaproteobacteria bacterium]|nr:hypothetical protein [Deltaproteobacteria bacterium]
MKWLSAIFIAFLTAVFSAVATVLIADVATRWHHVSDFEGARGMLIAFVWLPLSLIVGFVVGLVAARWKSASGRVLWYHAIGRAFGIASVILGLSTLVAWNTALHPPTIEGKELELQYEVRLPPAYPLQEDFEKQDFRAALVVSADDRSYSKIDFSAIEKRDGFIVVPAIAQLNSTSAHRTLSATYGEWNSTTALYQYVDIPLAAVPTRSDFEWSPWFTAEKGFDGAPIPIEKRIQFRYRVRFAS